MTPDETLEKRDKLMRLVGNLESILYAIETLSLPPSMNHASDLIEIASKALDKAYIKLLEDASNVE